MVTMLRIAYSTNDSVVVLNDFTGTEWTTTAVRGSGQIGIVTAREGTVFAVHMCAAYTRSLVDVIDASGPRTSTLLSMRINANRGITPFMYEGVLHASLVYNDVVSIISCNDKTRYMKAFNVQNVSSRHPLVMHNGIYYPSISDSPAYPNEIGCVLVGDHNLNDPHVCRAINPWTIYRYVLGDDCVIMRDMRTDDIMRMAIRPRGLTADHASLSLDIL